MRTKKRMIKKLLNAIDILNPKNRNPKRAAWRIHCANSLRVYWLNKNNLDFKKREDIR